MHEYSSFHLPRDGKEEMQLHYSPAIHSRSLLQIMTWSTRANPHASFSWTLEEAGLEQTRTTAGLFAGALSVLHMAPQELRDAISSHGPGQGFVLGISPAGEKLTTVSL